MFLLTCTILRSLGFDAAIAVWLERGVFRNETKRNGIEMETEWNRNVCLCMSSCRCFFLEGGFSTSDRERNREIPQERE